MGLEVVVSDILAQAKAEVEVINAHADAEVAEILDAAKVEAEKIKQAKAAFTDSTIERLNKQEMSSAHLEIKRAALNAKKEVLDSVYQSAREAISSIPAKKNTNLLKAIIDRYGGSGSRNYSNGRDAKLVQNMTDHIFMGEIDCLGGLVIENDDGSIRLDYTYDTILDDVWEKSLKQVSEILFS